MTPKEKAAELYDVFNSITPLDSRLTDTVEDANRKCLVDIKLTKQCALICVEEILKNIPEEVMSYKPFMMNSDYLQEVKEEINKL